MLSFSELNLSVLPELVLVIAGIAILMIEGFSKKLSRYAGIIAIIPIMVLFVYITRFLWGSNIKGYYNSIVLDNFALFASLIYLMAGALVILASISYLDIKKMESAEFYVLLLFAIAAMIFISSANDMIAIFISLEIFSVCLYALVAFERSSKIGVEGATKYFILGAFSAGILLYGIVLVYGAVGSTNLSALQTVHIANSEQKLLLYFGSALILIGLAFKISIVPFHMWTPDAYEGAPTVITAFMSAATKTAAFTVLIRIFMLNIQGDMVSLQWVLWVLAIITMVVGNVIALAQENIKRLLAYSSIAHAGYITVGAAACFNDKEVIGSMLYYLIVYAAMNIGAFIVISYLEDEKDFLSISHYKGLGYRKPWIGIALTWFLFCLAGLPPTSGFLAKYYVFLMAVRKGFPILVVIAVLNSALAAYYYLRIIAYIWMYGKEQGKALPKREQELAMIGKLAILIALGITIYFSFMPSLVLQLAKSF